MSEYRNKLDLPFTVQDLAAKVREIGLASPDFVYQPPDDDPDGQSLSGLTPDCKYLHREPHPTDPDPRAYILVPGCIIGHALIALGVTRDFLRECEGLRVPRVIEMIFGDFHGDFYENSSPVTSSPEARYLNLVQFGQDAGNPWGQCIASADLRCPWYAES